MNTIAVIYLLSHLLQTPEGVWSVLEYDHGYPCTLVVKPAKRGWSVEMRYAPEAHSPNYDAVWEGFMYGQGDLYVERSTSRFYPDIVAVGLWRMRKGQLEQIERRLLMKAPVRRQDQP